MGAIADFAGLVMIILMVLEISCAEEHLGFCNALVQCHIGHVSSLLLPEASASKVMADS